MPELIQMLWIGPRLSAMERLSIASFLAIGHAVRLYSYGDVEGIPPGVEHHDAREVLPAGSVFTYAEGFGKGSYAPPNSRVMLECYAIANEANPADCAYEQLKRRYPAM